jgi:hypothetical protein
MCLYKNFGCSSNHRSNKSIAVQVFIERHHVSENVPLTARINYFQRVVMATLLCC